MKNQSLGEWHSLVHFRITRMPGYTTLTPCGGYAVTQRTRYPGTLKNREQVNCEECLVKFDIYLLRGGRMAVSGGIWKDTMGPET